MNHLDSETVERLNDDLKQTYDKICETVIKGHRIMVIMRGLPGSGKTYTAYKIISTLFSESKNKQGKLVFSFADYKNEEKDTSVAHRQYIFDIENSLNLYFSPIIIDDDNLDYNKMEIYARMAVFYGYYIEIVEPLTSWKFDSHILVEKCCNRVSIEEINRMFETYQTCNITGDKLLKSCGIKYSAFVNNPPQLASNKVERALLEDDSSEDDTESVRSSESLSNAVNTDISNSKNSEAKSTVNQIETQPETFTLTEREPIKLEDLVDTYDKVKKTVKNGHRIAVFTRGCHGSGKTYAAKKLIEQIFGESENPEKYIFSIDDYFIHKMNKYDKNDRLEQITSVTTNIFRLVQNMIDQIEKNILQAMESGISPVIIDDNNIKVVDMKKFVRMAVSNGYYVETLEPLTTWKYDTNILGEKCTDFISSSKIEEIMSEYEHNITGDLLLAVSHTKYPSNLVPPQLASNLNNLQFYSQDLEKPSTSHCKQVSYVTSNRKTAQSTKETEILKKPSVPTLQISSNKTNLKNLTSVNETPVKKDTTLPPSYIESLPERKIKLALLGANAVGKTSLIGQLKGEKFFENFQPITFLSFYTYEEIIDHKRIKIEIRDTGGEEKFRSLMPNFVRGIDGAVLVYDISRAKTFQELSYYLDFLEACVPNTHKMFLGTKLDMDRREIQFEKVQELAKDRGIALCFETSCKNYYNVDYAFTRFAKMIVNAQINAELNKSCGLKKTETPENEAFQLTRKKLEKRKGCWVTAPFRWVGSLFD